jgi:hypothetical protein
MKVRVVLEVEVSETIADTMYRTGFTVCADGSSMQVTIPNTPAIPKRKTKFVFIDNPKIDLKNVIDGESVRTKTSKKDKDN